MTWEKHLEDSWFRKEDCAYAGKDHTKNNKTYICMYYDNAQNRGVEKTKFRTLQAAMTYVDLHCPLTT